MATLFPDFTRLYFLLSDSSKTLENIELYTCHEPFNCYLELLHVINVFAITRESLRERILYNTK